MKANQIIAAIVLVLSVSALALALLTTVTNTAFSGEYHYWQPEEIALLGSDLMFILTAISSFGIRRGKRWGVSLYAASTIIGIPLILLVGDSSGLGLFVEYASFPIFIAVLAVVLVVRLRSAPIQ